MQLVLQNIKRGKCWGLCLKILTLKSITENVVSCFLGASIVGVNCHFDPATCLRTIKLMKEGLAAAKLKAHLMSQPLAFHTPDCGKQGFIDLPEFPFGKISLLFFCGYQGRRKIV